MTEDLLIVIPGAVEESLELSLDALSGLRIATAY
jgi:hypothetical protein